jgi:energy-coupling factor transporter ATP-binding protein EcfA2
LNVDTASSPTPAPAFAEIKAALAQLAQVVSQPRALVIAPEHRGQLLQVVERARAQFAGPADAVLTIALAGNAGAGKSTLINALAGAPIASTSDRRPCTSLVKVYHHQAVPRGGLPHEVAEAAEFVAHDRPELRLKTIVDTPDLNTFKTENRARTRGLLKAAGLVVYVFTPEDYLDERLWSVIRDEQRFAGCIAVVNKADRYPTKAVANAVEEFRTRFRELGAPEISVLRVCAACHAPDHSGVTLPLPAGVTDEFVALRDFIESELREGDLAHLRAEQRARLVDHLQDEVERLAPATVRGALDELGATTEKRAARTADELARNLAAALPALEAELEPIAALRLHAAFFGPFRVWLATTDFLRFGLPRLIRSWRASQQAPRIAEFLLASGGESALTDPLRSAVRDLQDFCFHHALPADPWRKVESEANGTLFAQRLADAVELRFETGAAAAAHRYRGVVLATSIVGWLVPAALTVPAVWRLAMSLWYGAPAGVDVVVTFAALCGFTFFALHAAVAVALASGRPFARGGIAAKVVQDEATDWLRRWVADYRAEVESDLRALTEPVEILRASIGAAALGYAPVNALHSPPEPAGAPDIATPVPAIRNNASAPTPTPELSPDPSSPPTPSAEAPLTAGDALRRALARNSEHPNGTGV